MAAGRSRLARDLEPDDVLHPEVTWRGYPARVVKVGLPGEHQSHVGVLMQAPLEAPRERSRHDREDQLGCGRLSLPARREVRLAGDLAHTCTWPATAGEVRVAVAERELTRAKRRLADAKRKLAEEGEEGYRAQAVSVWTDRVAACLGELDAAPAGSGRRLPAAAGRQHLDPPTDPADAQGDEDLGLDVIDRSSCPPERLLEELVLQRVTADPRLTPVLPKFGRLARRWADDPFLELAIHLVDPDAPRSS